MLRVRRPTEPATHNAMRASRGFTLIELLIVIGLIAILSAIAVAGYDLYLKRAYEAEAIAYMRSWVPAQELYLQTFGHHADADETLAQNPLRILVVPTKAPYRFSIDSSASATTHWWGRGNPTQPGLRFFYIDETGRLLSSLERPPSP